MLSGTIASPRAERTTVSDLLDVLLSDYDLNGKDIEWARYKVKRSRPFLR